MKYKLITDLNSKFRKDLEYGITNTLLLINNKSKEGRRFILPRNYWTRGTNDNDRRKIYELLSKYGFMTRERAKYGEIVQNKTSGRRFKKLPYIYEISDVLKQILSDLVKELVHKNWVKAHAYNGMQEVKYIIKKFFKNTVFHSDKHKNHIFTIKGERYSLSKYKNGMIYIKKGQEILEWMYFYDLILKRNGRYI